MNTRHFCPFGRTAIATLSALLLALPALAQSQPPAAPPSPQQRAGTPSRIGVEAFGGVTVSWPAAADSFDASGLESRPTQFGGGGRVTSIWRDLFAEVAVSRWSDTGERLFIDSTGERFPLGIPLSVKATYLDISAGWKAPVRTRTGRTALLTFVGAGGGVVMYSESSPFAEAGEDVDTRATSWNAFAGVEVPILRWMAVSVEGRYRHVPDLLGEGGVSGVLGDDSLGGFQAGVALRVGFGGDSQMRPRAPQPGGQPAPDPTRPYVAPPSVDPRPPAVDTSTATIIETAPVFLLPDARRTPLRQLDAGTTVRVLEISGDWIRIEFRDPRFGARVGYVERKFVKIKTPDASR